MSDLGLIDAQLCENLGFGEDEALNVSENLVGTYLLRLKFLRCSRELVPEVLVLGSEQ
jgi:hypothetical protein